MTLRSDSDSFLKPSLAAPRSTMSCSTTAVPPARSSVVSRSLSTSVMGEEGSGNGNGSKKKSAVHNGIKNLASHLGVVRKRKRRGDTASSAGAGSCDVSTLFDDSDISMGDNSAFLDPNETDDDVSSVCSMDMSPPETKRKKSSSNSLSRVTSFASVFSTPMAKMGRAMHRSISSAKLPPPLISSPMLQPQTSRSESSGGGGNNTPTKFFNRSMSVMHVPISQQQQQHQNGAMKAPDSPFGTLKRGGSGRGSSTHLTPYKPPQPTPNKQRQTRYWSSQFPESCAGLSKQEIKHQEAIFEICCGEEDLVEDLKLVQTTYAETLFKLKIFSSEEDKLMFGGLKYLQPLHFELFTALKNLRSPQSGISRPVGKVLSAWVDKVGKPYVSYCSDLVQTKAFLDARKETDKGFSDFLQRCLESPFSRKLDLWSYLDVPRSKLFKYPLLMKQVLKFSECPIDCANMADAIRKMDKILNEVECGVAQANCKHTISRLDWLDGNLEQMEAVTNATEEMLHGTLKNNRGTKLECYLMDTVLILGRPTTHGHGGAKKLQLYCTPIPVEELVVEDLDSHSGHGSGSSTGSSGSRHGSFKSAFSAGSSQQTVKNSFRVSFRDDPLRVLNVGNSRKSQQLTHTLTALDEHSKRQWLSVLQKTIDSFVCKQNANTLTVHVEQQEETDSAKKRKAQLLCPPSSRTALFQKNKRSPRIKASLSHASIDSLKRSGIGAKKVARKSHHSTSALLTLNRTNNELLVPKVIVTQPPPTESKGRRMYERGMKENRQQMLLQERGRTKSWSQLKSNRTIQDGEGEPRYLTRSRAKISKSMSDLLQM